MSVNEGGVDPVSAPPSLLRGSLTAGRLAISSDPRDRRAERCQQSRRESEQQQRATVVRCAERLHQCGLPWRQAAHEVRTSERTLRSWRAHPGRAPRRRGRLPLATTRQQRSEVLQFLHHISGAAVGLPCLVGLFRHVPRAILADLLRRYRCVWRRRYRRNGYRLIWHVPGRVWAIDHSRATHCVDGVYRQIFAVRDVASHRQLAWEPVRSTGADEIRPILLTLFAQYGPPLVIKSDNGSAFRSAETRGWMLAWEALQLFSPVGYPQYNGQLERSNAINKTYTHQHAVAQGHPQQWTQDDLDAARQLTNSISRPWGARGGTPDECWAMRAPITVEERDAFEEEVSRQRQEARHELGLEESAVLEVDTTDEVERRAIGRSLEVCGYLTKVEQTRAPRAKHRRRRESLERALRKQRESRDAPPEHESQSQDAGHTAVSPQGDPSSRQVPRATEQEFAATNLAIAPRSDTIPMVIDKCSLESNTRPPPCVAQRERPLSSWWRRPITLLISKVKAAIIPR